MWKCSFATLFLQPDVSEINLFFCEANMDSVSTFYIITFVTNYRKHYEWFRSSLKTVGFIVVPEIQVFEVKKIQEFEVTTIGIHFNVPGKKADNLIPMFIVI